MEITCPSGLRGRIRGMKVREEKILADRKLAKAGTQLDELLHACWVETVDAGPYALRGGQLDWSHVLQGDGFYVLMQIRIATYGPDYAFSVGCRNAACRARIEWEFNLEDLPVRELDASGRASFAAGNRIEMSLPDAERRVWFKLLTGVDERELARTAAADGALSHVLGLRVVQVDGVDARDRAEFLADLSLRDADFLFDAFDRHDCGVETSIEIQCPECLDTQDLELPFDPSFFLPGKERTRRRAAQTSSHGSRSTIGARGSSSSSGISTAAAG